MHRSKNASLDHFIGERKQLRWNLKPQRLSGLEVDCPAPTGSLPVTKTTGMV